MSEHSEHRFRLYDVTGPQAAAHVAGCTCGWQDTDNPTDQRMGAYMRWKREHMDGADQHARSEAA